MYENYINGYEDGYYGYPPRMLQNEDYMEGYQDGEMDYVGAEWHYKG